MGRLWAKFQEKISGLASEKTPEPVKLPAPPAPPMRAYRHEILNEEQRRDLMEIVNLPGYEVLLDLHESTLEGFITHLVETAPWETEKVLALHKLVHSGYLFNRSVQQQVSVYKQLDEAENAEAREMQAALVRQTSDPLSDGTTLNKVLNPLYVPEPPPPKPVVVHPKQVSPLDTMLKSVE
jgi:hypothetical protein